MKKQYIKRHRLVEILIHIIGWGIVLGFPLFFISQEESTINWRVYLFHSAVPLSLMLVFYLNHFIFIPNYLFTQRLKHFLTLNIILIIFAVLFLSFWQDFSMTHLLKEGVLTRPNRPPGWILSVRDSFSMILSVGLSIAIRMSSRLGEIESARREAERSRAEAEKDRVEAELNNLKNQLNPHFLLNTLNNIYSLISFDGDKAQQAVQELSKLLRYVLYDNQQTYVSLVKEMEFIRNYIELMRIRLCASVTVETKINISPNSRTEIAPLIFISLIENAFKHGISPTEPSYIGILFFELGSEVHCQITNSYHPKSQSDKSGSGIGLQQVSKRLELLYPNRYIWTHELDETKKEYYSKLIINCDNH